MKMIPDTHTPHRRRLPMTSLIDVVFLLLIYFIVTSSMSPAEAELLSGLQAEQRKTGGASDIQPQVVLVDVVEGKPAFIMGARVMRTKDELVSVLKQLPQDAGVFVKVTGFAPVQAAATALQAVRDAGFVRVTYVPADEPHG
ncbi:MAG: biopolymer transporter ExbD [Phycisphaeraceae bacterium]|nr:biopolymer transporter ExbD [Phycisphaerales bacterium]MCB9860954.1 biopolymer transporter ExbD [Phycisphaeraceae bacterium]